MESTFAVKTISVRLPGISVSSFPAQAHWPVHAGRVRVGYRRHNKRALQQRRQGFTGHSAESLRWTWTADIDQPAYTSQRRHPYCDVACRRFSEACIHHALQLCKLANWHCHMLALCTHVRLQAFKDPGMTLACHSCKQTLWIPGWKSPLVL